MARTPHLRYVRHRSFNRLRHGTRFMAFLKDQADRLLITAKEVFEDLMVSQGLTADQIAGKATPANPSITSVIITGTAQVGQLLTAVAQSLGQPAATITYVWKADTVAISGATASTYTPVVGDIGKVITVAATATNSEGTDTKESEATSAVIAA